MFFSRRTSLTPCSFPPLTNPNKEICFLQLQIFTGFSESPLVPSVHRSQQVEPPPSPPPTAPRWGPGGSEAAACCCRCCDLYARQKKGWRRRGGFVLNITSKETRLPLFPRRRWRLCSGRKLLSRPVVALRSSALLLRPRFGGLWTPTPAHQSLYRHQTGGGVEQRALDQLLKVT